MMQVATILYEDQRAAQIKAYGPHEFVLQCLADRMAPLDRSDLQDVITANPRKGAPKIRQECKDEAKRDRLYKTTRRLVAVYDRDRIKDVIATPASCTSGIRDALRSESAWGDRLIVVLLDRKTETVLDAILAVEGRGPLLSKPRPDERDKILLRAAWQHSPAERAAVLTAVPSLAYLVAKLEELLRDFLTAGAA